MTYITTSFRDRLQESFFHIMFDEDCTDRRNKRFRIFYFSFYFGAITADALPVVFFDDPELSRKNYSEARNYSFTLLKYLAKNGYLNQISSDTYTLSSVGTSSLFGHLLEGKYMYNKDESLFKHAQKTCPSHTTHASNNGIAILQFIRYKRQSFEVEPFFSNTGNIVPAGLSTASQKYLSPDAFIRNVNLSEDYYIETDNCEERLTKQLVPKLHKYLSSVLAASEGTCIDTTILFSVWHKHSQLKGESDLSRSYNEQLAFIDYFEKCFSDKITCNNLFKSFRQYHGSCTLIEELKQTIPETDSCDIESYSFGKDLLKLQVMLRAFDMKFAARRDTIYKSILRVNGLKKILLEGTRLICFPLFGQSDLYKFLFFEQEKYNKIPSFLIRKKHSFNCIVNYHKLMIFRDIKTGDKYAFRNVFQCSFKKQTYYYIIENITEDFGGYFRVEKFLKRKRIIIEENIHLYCLYNSRILPNPATVVELSKDGKPVVEFVSYEKAILNDFSRDENFL